MIEHGRPLRCSIIQAPTLSKYFARSSLVIAPSSLVGPKDLVRAAKRHSHDDASTWGRSGGCGLLCVDGAGAGLAMSVLSEGAGISASTSLAGLSWRSPLNAACRIMPAAGEPSKLDLSHEFRLQPVHPGLLAGRILAAERVGLRCRSLELRHQARDLVGSVARSDIADVDQVVASIDARHQRPELAAIAVPAADDHLVSGAALGLGPRVAFVPKRNEPRLVLRRCLPATSGRRI